MSTSPLVSPGSAQQIWPAPPGPAVLAPAAVVAPTAVLAPAAGIAPTALDAAAPVNTPADGSRTRPPAGRGKLFVLAWANVALVIPGWLAFSLLITSVATIVVWVGLVLWLISALCLQVFSAANRGIAGAVLGQPVTAVYKPWTGSGLFTHLRTVLTDSARWRDVAFLFVSLSLGFAMSLSAVIAFIIFPLGYWLSPLLMRTYALTTKALIGPTSEAVLQQRIGQLESSRSESVDHSAAELRRIERDLHDGAQAQLVALGMNLGLAEELISKDPDAAAALIAEARTSSKTALADLRMLVRGIHPPVLADRGLAGGLQALALSSPLEVEVDIDLAGRPPAPVESAVYFAVAEALTNAAKHASAGRIWIWVRHMDGRTVESGTGGRTVGSGTDGRTVGSGTGGRTVESGTDGVLTALVGDDGVGGARLTPDGGLSGIERRLAAFDGGLALASPLGGPTIVTLTVPCRLEPVVPTSGD